jgi:hypothetical protein
MLGTGSESVADPLRLIVFRSLTPMTTMAAASTPSGPSPVLGGVDQVSHDPGPLPGS